MRASSFMSDGIDRQEPAAIKYAREYQLRNAQNNFPNSVFCITHISLE